MTTESILFNISTTVQEENLLTQVWINSSENGTLYAPPVEYNLLAPMIFITILSVIGVPGNALILIVFTLKHKPSVYRTIILTLAIYDLLVCGITLPFEFYNLYNYVMFRAEWACKIFRTFSYFFFFNSSSVIQLMTVERFRRVCRPLKRQMSLRVAMICIFIICLVSATLTVPNLFIRGIYRIPLGNNITGYDCSISEDFLHNRLPVICNATLLLTCICNITVIIVLYIFIGRQIYKHFQFIKSFKSSNSNKKNISSSELVISISFRQNSISFVDGKSRNSSSEQPVNNLASKMADSSNYKSTKIAIMISICYVLSYIPTLLEGVLEGIYGETVLSKYISVSVINIIEKTFAINHVINPFIYGFIDKKFREDCKDIIQLVVKKCFCKQ